MWASDQIVAARRKRYIVVEVGFGGNSGIDGIFVTHYPEGGFENKMAIFRRNQG